MIPADLWSHAVLECISKPKALDVFKVGDLRGVAKQEMSAANRVAYEKENTSRDTIKIRLPNQYKTK